MNTDRKHIDISGIRSHLAGKTGPQYWRSLEELADTDAFRELMQNEFPGQMVTFRDLPNRRKFIALMGSTLALAGLGGCTSSVPQNIVPYVRAPEEIVAGKPLFFATAMPIAGYGIGLIAQSTMGRPTRVDGNPAHPASLGSSDVFTQASVWSLYDPDRAQAITASGRIRAWSDFSNAISSELDVAGSNRGARMRILTETVTSPTLARQCERMLQRFPMAQWTSYEPTGDDNVRAGARLAFGRDLDTQFRMERADVILSLDSDFLSIGPGHVRYTRDFTSRRKPHAPDLPMNRLYVAESTLSITGAMADHRFAVRSSEIESLTSALMHRLGDAADTPAAADGYGSQWPWLDAVVRDLQQHRENSLVLTGTAQPAGVHARVHAMNSLLRNFGKTVVTTDPVQANPGDSASALRVLVDDMQSGRVDLLIVLGGNPVYTAPADLEFAKSMESVRMKIHLSPYADETSTQCHWHIPETHYLESWGDVRAYDGTASIIQPLIEPLYAGKSAIELMSLIIGEPLQSGYDTLRDYWKQRIGGTNFEIGWRQAVHDGVVAETAAPIREVPVKADFRLPDSLANSSLDSHSNVEIVIRTDPTVLDGRFSNNGWLQELPKPITRLTWDNAALLSPSTAERFHLANGDVTEIRADNRSIKAPVWIAPGHADNSITIHLGYGRTRGGRLADGQGFNAYAIRTSQAPWIVPSVEFRKTGERYPLASTQLHQNMENRGNIRTSTADRYASNPDFISGSERSVPKELTLYPDVSHSEYAWGMSIDLTSCVGCNACVVACQAENNIPIVGKIEVQRGREMHWIRLDTYYSGALDRPDAFFQPVPCMHCENAPCELVCPVGATTHSVEGLNEMTYNRCVGTRYCSNNCPYKVRRFNFFEYSDFQSEGLKLLSNPDVSVRSRGVMEKCTYCVQRINRARIAAEEQADETDRRIRDGDIVTACQAACPANAIVFGDIHDPESRVSKLKAEPRSYGLLAELNTRPRTTYLAKLTNPNPEIARGKS